VTTGNTNVAVRGIVWSEDKPAAIIGTEIVYKGETIQDLKIVDITRDSVEFEQNGKTWIQKIVN
jgi:type II secretory pathway component PulC